MLTTLQNFIFHPHSLELSHLYIRGNNYTVIDENTIKIKSYNSIAFDTYYNFFSLKKWMTYCDLDDIYLEFEYLGEFQISVVGISHRNTFYTYERDLHLEYLMSPDNFATYRVKIDQFSEFEAIYLSISSGSIDSIIKSVKYTTRTKTLDEGYKLGVCICTFNRQTYIQKSVDILSQGILKNNVNIDVIITNNGSPISLEKDYDNIHIYKSNNMGGAGGFTNSMCKAIERNCSHILLMDDDISFNFESLFRTYRFFQFIKQAYADIMLSGSMFSADERWLQYERNTILDSKGFHHQGHFQDMRSRNVVIDDIFADSIHGLSGWWFSAFSRKIVQEYGLPLPIFVRGDDIEFSMRTNKEIVSLNGINVWHEPFILKYNEIMEDYYLPRNMIINALL